MSKNDGILELDGQSLTIGDIVKVARGGVRVALRASAKERVAACADAVRGWTEAGKAVYGITTGFGDLATVAIPPEDCGTLQRNLILSHSCGLGEPLSEELVRAVMLLRVNTLARGHSGISPATLSLLTDFLNHGIHPVVPEQGSLGASGDLCQLSHLALPLIGLGEVFYRGRRVPSAEALREAGLAPVTLLPKEGLALNNGTTVMIAVASLALHDAAALLKNADIAGALSLEALHGVPYAFDPRTHDLRPHTGQRVTAGNIRRLIEGSLILERHKGQRVQDAYSLRCIPQVHGAVRDALAYVREKIEIEINSVTDNPIIFPDDDEAISGGNFHGEPIALAMDFFGIAAAELASISERRTARLVDAKLSGLPPFLVAECGLNSGFMIPHYTAAAIVSENKVLAHPSSVDSIPTSAGQEDHVSMGGYAARKALQILTNARRVIGIELLCAAQGLEFSLPDKPGAGTEAAYTAIRNRVPFLKKDIYMQPYLLEAITMIDKSDVLRAVEDRIGSLD